MRTAIKLSNCLTGLFLCAWCIGLQADGLPPLNKVHQLEPLDGNGIKFYQGFSELLTKVEPKADRRLASIYIHQGNDPLGLVGIYATSGGNVYYLLYVDVTHESKTTTMTLPAAFASKVNDELESILVLGTHYSTQSIPLIGCLGARDYMFESWKTYYGSVIDCVAADSALHLVRVANDLVDLANLKSAPEDERNKKMAEVLSELDAANSMASKTQ